MGPTSRRTSGMPVSSARSRTRWPVTNSPPCAVMSSARAWAMRSLPPSGRGQPVLCAVWPSSMATAAEASEGSGPTACAATPARRARASGVVKGLRGRAWVRTRVARRTAATGSRGGWRRSERRSSTTAAERSTKGPISRAQRGPSGPSCSAVRVMLRQAATERPPASGWAYGISGWSSRTPLEGRSKAVKKGRRRPSGGRLSRCRGGCRCRTGTGSAGRRRWCRPVRTGPRAGRRGPG